jgi:hypothetical protein
MILHVNHLQPGVAAAAGETVGALLALVEEAGLDARLLASLRLHLDWIQYRSNFRDPVSLRRAARAAPRGSRRVNSGVIVL